MLTKHFSHIFYEPKQSLQDADREPAKITDIMLHVAFLSLIPTVCGYIATVYIGWDLGVGTPFMMAQDKAITIALFAFIAFNVGVYAIGYSICWLAKTFDIQPNNLHCTELAVFTSLPLFALGFVALYPVLYINVIVGLFAIAAAVYLLYIGVPIFMHIPEEEGFVYSTWVVTIGLVMLVVFLGASVFLLSALSA
jgi:Yip1-like protein